MWAVIYQMVLMFSVGARVMCGPTFLTNFFMHWIPWTTTSGQKFRRENIDMQEPIQSTRCCLLRPRNKPLDLLVFMGESIHWKTKPLSLKTFLNRSLIAHLC